MNFAGGGDVRLFDFEPLRQQGNLMSFLNLRIRGRLYGGFAALLLFCAGSPALRCGS
jgi:hypothetical protein